MKDNGSRLLDGLDYVQSYEYDEREKKNREKRHIEEAVKEAREEAKNEGISLGITQGITQGRAEERYEIAKNLLKTNTSIEIIVSSTGLTKEEVENLK